MHDVQPETLTSPNEGASMRIKLILPALTEATSPFYRPIKYSLFPPLGLATLAAHVSDEDEVELCDEHVAPISDGDVPDVVGIEVYVTNARRSYELAALYRARGAYVCLGGLHATACPGQAALHADTVFLGPGDDTWPHFLRDFRAGHPRARYQSIRRCLHGSPLPRRDLIDRRRYLAPNSIVVSRGCPHSCHFCYKESFFEGGRSFYTRHQDEALAEIESLPGRHLFFLDDHLFGDDAFARGLFGGMCGMGRVWQAAGTVESVLRPGLMEAAAQSGLRSLFVGFETLSQEGLERCGKRHNRLAEYERAVAHLHELDVMVNASFVFGIDGDDSDVFDRTTEWAVSQGIETATFHILTPYPGTALHRRLTAEGRMLTSDWDLYDTRHVVFQPRGMTVDELERGYWRAYRDFYSWRSITRGTLARETPRDRLRHLAYQVGWKKAEPVWDALIRTRRLGLAVPLLERMLQGTQVQSPAAHRRESTPSQENQGVGPFDREDLPVTSTST
jgi:radical SAM superfamily enzyme YgiQ (UPF0313 family)